MVRTPSTMMLAPGTPLPSFALPGLDGKLVTDVQFRGSPGLLVAFICTHCPFVKHIRREFARFTNERVLPIIGDAFDQARFPDELVPEIASLGLLGATLPAEYGGGGLGAVSYGLICQELERGDSGLRSFVSVQSSLCMYPIYAYGSEEQRQQ